MYDLFDFINGYIKHAENKTYSDIKEKNKEDKIKSMLSAEEYEIYEQLKTADRQRLLKFQ